MPPYQARWKNVPKARHIKIEWCLGTACATGRPWRSHHPAMRERMHAAYTQAARLEWMFWDVAYRLEAWPV